jgi:FkbM family methyltransferase
MNKLIKIISFIKQHPLAGKHLFKAYFRFFSWQIFQTILPQQCVVPLVGNSKLFMRKGLSGATGNFYTGLLEFSEMAFLLHTLRKEDCFADVGANVGVYTILASSFCGAFSMAFEPVPSSYQWLEKNVELNNIEKKVVAYNQGVGASAGYLHFSTIHDTVNHVVHFEKTGETTKVAVNSLEFFFKSNRVPLLMKVDVEGFETEVINGLGKFLFDNQLKAIIIELNGSGGRYGYDEEALHLRFIDAGFSPYAYDPFTRNLEKLNKRGPFNTIYIRDFLFIKDRIINAEPVKVFGESF